MKQTFASDTFASRTFTSNTWAGEGDPVAYIWDAPHIRLPRAEGAAAFRDDVPTELSRLTMAGSEQ
jgi:hypothetical protein